MKTTGVYTEHEFPINFDKWNQPVSIVPFGDVHWGHKACNEQLFLDEIAYGKGRTDVWYVGMGDYFDAMSTSERDAINKASLHESTKEDLDDLFRKRADLFLEKLKHCQGRIIGMVEGNHFTRLDSGITTTQYMCEQLKCKYLGVMTATRLNFHKDNTHFNYDIIAHHGMGAARLPGGSINRVAQMGEGWDGDLFLMGHDHKAVVAREVRCYLDKHPRAGLRIKDKVIYSARTGSYLRGFVNGKVSYVADMAGRPLPLGGIRIEITPVQKVVEGEKQRYLMPRVVV